MCGIVGLLDVEPGRQNWVGKVRGAVEVMRHRGPDDLVAAELAGAGAWGMCRLAIRDPSPCGRQPFWHDRVGLIFNGEIYNTDQLRSSLERRGHRFETKCDTEVLLKMFVEFGTAAFGLLDGIFAVAIVDPTSNQFILARDEFGVKPLFVNYMDGRLIFGSEPKALRLLGGLDDGVDETQLLRYLRYQYVPEPGTPWRNVRRVARGTFEVYRLDEVRLRRTESFVQPGLGQPMTPHDENEWIDATDEAIRVSVCRQLVSDRPLGVFLSGGVDSTLISAYASDQRPGVRAFGISVPGWDRDERLFMEEAGRRLEIDLTITPIQESDFDRLTDRMLETYDEPFGDFSALPTMLISETVAREMRVVLSGDGGDEMFGGYSRYSYAALAEALSNLPVSLLRVIAAGLNATGVGPRWLIERVIDEASGGGHGYSALLALRTFSQAAALLGISDAEPWPLAPRARGLRSWSRPDAIATAMAIDIDQYLPADIHTKVDRATMSVSLEARVPLLGGPVARLAETMPSSVKVRDGIGKWPLKQLLRRRGFAEDFVNRPKMGFSIPMSAWLAAAIRRRSDYEDLLRSPPSPIEPDVSGALLDSLLQGHDVAHATWSLLMLSAWLTRENT